MNELKLSTEMFNFFNDAYRWRTLVDPLRARDALLGMIIAQEFFSVSIYRL